jgi:hypothetical protein
MQMSKIVIASATKQSMVMLGEKWIASSLSLLAMTGLETRLVEEGMN